LGNLAEALARDRIVATCVQNNRLCLGTEGGWLHVASLISGQIIRTLKAHDSPVLCVSMDTTGSIVSYKHTHLRTHTQAV